MHVPPAFREGDLDVLHALIREAPLAQVVASTAEGLIATPLPLLLVAEEGAYGTLYGHFARANPQWKAPPLAPTLVIFMAADAYVTPAWYAAKQDHGKVVPTWNYECVQAYGQPEFFHDRGRLRDLVTRLTDVHEAGRDGPWRVTDAPTDYIDGLLGAIVGFRMPIERLIGKRKLSQNRSPEDRARVRAGLAGAAGGRTPRLAVAD